METFIIILDKIYLRMGIETDLEFLLMWRGWKYVGLEGRTTNSRSVSCLNSWIALDELVFLGLFLIVKWL